MVEDPIFLEAQLELLRRIKADFCEPLYNARLDVDLGLSGKMDLVQWRTTLEDFTCTVQCLISWVDNETTHVRWKLKKARKAEQEN